MHAPNCCTYASTHAHAPRSHAPHAHDAHANDTHAHDTQRAPCTHTRCSKPHSTSNLTPGRTVTQPSPTSRTCIWHYPGRRLHARLYQLPLRSITNVCLARSPSAQQWDACQSDQALKHYRHVHTQHTRHSTTDGVLHGISQAAHTQHRRLKGKPAHHKTGCNNWLKPAPVTPSCCCSYKQLHTHQRAHWLAANLGVNS